MPAKSPYVSIRELDRKLSELLARVLNGERLVIRRYGVPIATIQPLNGIIRQPFDPIPYDPDGTPVGTLRAMAEALPTVQQDLLLSCNTEFNVDKFRIGHLSPQSSREVYEQSAFENMRVRGLAKKTKRGWVATGLGLALKDELETIRTEERREGA